MPIDPPPYPCPGRRALLVSGVGGAAALLAGCTGGGNGRGEPGEGSDPRSAERTPAAKRLRARSARDSLALLAVYDAAARVHPSLADRLAPLRSAVAQHAEAFGSRPRRSPTGPSASPRPGESPRTDGADGADGHTDGQDAGVPGDPGEALTALAAVERRTADSRITALAEAPPELARLLASVAAAGAAHAYLLTSGGVS